FVDQSQIISSLKYCWIREIFYCDGNTGGTPHVFIKAHIYLIICMMTNDISYRVSITLKNISLD
ncbi:hypothetical protein DVH24_014359, partial [Malus domestica]